MKHFMIMTMVLACIPFRAECVGGLFGKVEKVVSKAADQVEGETSRTAHRVEKVVSKAADQVEGETSRAADRIMGELYRCLQKEANKQNSQSKSEGEGQDLLSQFSANDIEKTEADVTVSKSTEEVSLVKKLEIAEKKLEVAESDLQIAEDRKKLEEAEAKNSGKELTEVELIQLDLAINEAKQRVQKAQLRVLELQLQQLNEAKTDQQ